MFLLCDFSRSLFALFKWFLLWFRYALSLNQVIELFQKLLYAPTQQVNIFIPFLKQHLSYRSSFAFIAHIYNDEFVWLILESEELRDQFVAADVWSRVIYRLFDMVKLVVLGVAQVKEQELSVLGYS